MKIKIIFTILVNFYSIALSNEIIDENKILKIYDVLFVRTVDQTLLNFLLFKNMAEI